MRHFLYALIKIILFVNQLNLQGLRFLSDDLRIDFILFYYGRADMSSLRIVPHTTFVTCHKL